jgi:hypothetical protein
MMVLAIMQYEEGWLAKEMRRTTELVEAMPNGRALVEEAAFRSEEDNRSEAAALHEEIALRRSTSRMDA